MLSVLQTVLDLQYFLWERIRTLIRWMKEARKRTAVSVLTAVKSLTESFVSVWFTHRRCSCVTLSLSSLSWHLKTITSVCALSFQQSLSEHRGFTSASQRGKRFSEPAVLHKRFPVLTFTLMVNEGITDCWPWAAQTVCRVCRAA